MYKILICDDNPLIRRSISDTINWTALGCEVVGTAENGLDAWALIKALSPDIIISDIKMPALTGIQLIEKITVEGITAKVIFITGFQEFEYARKAIHYGAVEYLLKPIKNDDLIQAVQKALTTAPADKPETPVVSDSLAELKTTAIQICTALNKNMNIANVSDTTADLAAEINACNNPVEIAEYVNGAIKAFKTQVISDDISPLVKKVIALLEARYAENVSLTEVAQLFNVSAGYLSRLLKKETDMNFTDIVARIRIDKAKEHLHDKHLKIIDVSYLVGFSDYTYFSQVFKKLESMSPNEYRKLFCIL